VKPRKLKVKFDKGHNEATLSLVDEDGNGIILLHGKVGGCEFMSVDEQEGRLDTLKRLWLRGAKQPDMDAHPHFDNFFPSIRADIEKYGRACFNHGLEIGLRPAKVMLNWLTSKPPMKQDYLREMLQKEINAELAKKHTE
jgi:hypothetical protein